MSGFSRETEPLSNMCVCVCVCVYAHLAYTIMEAEKSQDLVSAIWTYVLIYVF